jgi:hypothetical protein
MLGTDRGQICFDEEAHLYTRDGVPYRSVTQIIAEAGWCDFSFVEEELRIHSMKRGKSVHWLLQLEDQAALDYRRVPVALRGYRKAWQAWKKASGFMVELVEWRFISERGFAGTLDRYGYLPPTELYPHLTSAIIDIKSGPVADWTRLQLAAYAVGHQPRLALARRIRRIGVELRKDGRYKATEFPMATFDQDISKFMEAARCL